VNGRLLSQYWPMPALAMLNDPMFFDLVASIPPSASIRVKARALPA
jgi:hypothetical protein